MTYSELSLVAAALFLGSVAALTVLRKPFKTLPTLAVVAGAVLLIAGCWSALHSGSLLAAVLICLGVGGVALAFASSRDEPVPRPLDIPELAVAGGIVAASAALRFIDIKSFPGFIHGEESFWSWISGTYWFSSERPWPVEQYTQGVPVSFYLEWPFFKIFGVNFYAPRYEVAFIGTLSVALMYLIGRRLAGSWAGLVAAALLSTSMVSLAGSRAAFVWGHALFWTVLTLFLYVETVHRRSILFAAVTGVTLCLGCLTYHTYLPVVAAVVLHALYLSGSELLRKRKAEPYALVTPLLLVAPTLVLWPRISKYLSTMRDYTTSASHSLTNIGPEFWQAPDKYISLGFENSKVLLHQLFVKQVFPDFLVTNTDGPTLLPGIALLALAGIGVLLPRIWKPWPSLLILWMVIPLAFSPVVLGQPLIRTYSSAYPAIYLLAAQGLVATAVAAREALARMRFQVAVPMAASAAVVALAVTGSLIYFNRTASTVDGEVRKGFVDDVLASADPGERIVLPYVLNTSDWVEVEQYALRFAIAGHFGGFGAADGHYKLVPVPQFLSELQAAGSAPQLVAVQSPKAGPVSPTESADIANAINTCYPGTSWNDTGFWLVAEVKAQDRKCDAQATIKLSGATRGPTGEPVFQWDGPSGGSYRLVVEKKAPQVQDFEMERFNSSNGWASDAKFVSGYAGTGYYFDNLSATTASIDFPVGSAGSYTVWMRTFRRRADDTGWRTAIDGQAGADLSPVPGTALNQWNWEKVGAYSLAAGRNNLKIERHGSGWAIFIDEMYLSADPGFDPAKQPLWQSVAERTSNDSGGHRSVSLDAPLAPGTYRWSVTALDGQAVDGLGRPLTTPYQEFAAP